MTLKQKQAIKNVVGNGGNITKAMLDAGYSPNTANTPSKLTNSEAWQELVEKHLPDDKLLRKHDEALEANKVISAKIIGTNANENTDDFIEVPDHQVRLKAVELGYKLKRKMGDNSGGIAVQVNFNEHVKKELEEFE